MPHLIDFANIALQLATIIVLIFTCVAAFKQASAARKLIEATDQQIETSKSLASAATAQNAIASQQTDESVRPILIFKWVIAGKFSKYPIAQNDGRGPAVDCRWYYGQIDTTNPKVEQMDYEVIGSQQEIQLHIELEKAKSEGITMLYNSLTGKSYATEVTWWTESLRCKYQEHIPRG